MKGSYYESLNIHLEKKQLQQQQDLFQVSFQDF